MEEKNKILFIELWMVFVNIKAKTGFDFRDLIDSYEKNKNEFKGAWANLIVRAKTINEAIDIVPLGLSELNFDVGFIDKIENIGTLAENNEVKAEVLEECDWLLENGYVFKISDKLFPYEYLRAGIRKNTVKSTERFFKNSILADTTQFQPMA
jgi:hypothetical protein